MTNEEEIGTIETNLAELYRQEVKEMYRILIVEDDRTIAGRGRPSGRWITRWHV